MEELLTGMYDVFTKLLPFFGCAALLALIFLFKAVITFLKDLKFTMDRVNTAIDKVNITIHDANKMLESMDEPMQTVVHVARTIDKVDAFSNRMFREAFTLIADNISAFVNWLKKIFAEEAAAKVATDDISKVENTERETENIEK